MEFKAKRRTLDVVVDGQKHSVRFPKAKEQYDLQASMKGVDEEKYGDVLFLFLADLGLPKEVALDLEAEDLKEIVEILTGQKKS